jgi:hypothetical protein
MAKQGTNSKIITVSNPDGDETLDVYVKYKWYYDPGCSHMSNGDPGYPSESEVEVIDFYPSENQSEPMPDWFDPEMLDEELWEEGDVFESEYDPEDYKD